MDVYREEYGSKQNGRGAYHASRRTRTLEKEMPLNNPQQRLRACHLGSRSKSGRTRDYREDIIAKSDGAVRVHENKQSKH